MSAIRVSGLVKSYGEVQAVGGLDLTVAEGEVVALLGPNGAGKTTTVEILEGFRRPDAGEVEVLGQQPTRGRTRLRQRVGIVLQESGIEDELTVREAIDHLRKAYDRPRETDDVIAAVGLEAKADERIKRLSGGQRRRLDLALAISGSPELLFLDEPTTGFDPEARREAWTVIRELVAEGTTVLLTTHYLEEAQALADRVAVIAGGRVVAEGPPDNLGNRMSAGATVRFHLARAEDATLLGLEPGDGGFVAFASDDPTADLHQLTGRAIEHGIDLIGLEVMRPTLEDAYLELIAHEDRPQG